MQKMLVLRRSGPYQRLLFSTIKSRDQPPSKEFLDAINKLSENLKISKVEDQYQSKYYDTKESRDFSHLLSERKRLKQTRLKFSEDELRKHFAQFSLLKELPEEHTELFKRLTEKYEIVEDKAHEN